MYILIYGVFTRINDTQIHMITYNKRKCSKQTLSFVKKKKSQTFCQNKIAQSITDHNVFGTK